MLKDGEARLRELDALPSLVEDYLADLPYLVRGAGIPVRDYEVVGPEKTADNPLGDYMLTPNNVRERTPEEMKELRLDVGELYNLHATRFQSLPEIPAAGKWRPKLKQSVPLSAL